MEREQWFLRPGEKFWRCGNCGKRLVVVKPSKQCPVCGKKNSFVVLDDKKFPLRP